MSVRYALPALLSQGPKHGLRLREEFQTWAGEVWPLNVDQVNTALQRLAREGWVESGAAGRAQRGFRITAEGEQKLAGWLRHD